MWWWWYPPPRLMMIFSAAKPQKSNADGAERHQAGENH
jgi:hypothetical protein